MGKVKIMNKTEDINSINTKISASFGKIEKDLSEAADTAGLFEILLTGIEKEFEVPFVWLTLMDTANNKPIIAAIKSSDVLQDRLKIITPELFHELLPAGLKPVLVNKDLQRYYKLLPSNRKYFVKSLALVPFKVNDEIAGSWNNGDAYYDRYTPDMETNLLQNLSHSISLRLIELVSKIK
jgi:uncharacterized protein YigA (DUF484 family)